MDSCGSDGNGAGAGHRCVRQRLYASVYSAHLSAFSKGPTQHAGDINQALIELGSTVCKVKDPNCASCPISSWCKAYTRASHQVRSPTRSSLHRLTSLQEKDIGDIEDLCQLCEPLPDDTSVTIYPMRIERKKAREEVDAVNVIEWRGHDPDQRSIMLVRRPENGILPLAISP